VPSLALRSLPLALLALPLLAVPASAKAPKKSSWTYSVTARAEMKESWSYDYATASPSPGQGLCTNDDNASGSAVVQVKTPRPQKMMVLRGFGGRPPAVGVGSEPFVTLTGAYRRIGSDIDKHGGDCEAANPPVVQPTSGCGERPFSVDLGFAWETRGTLRPSAFTDTFREDCPSSGHVGPKWDNDASPSLIDVLTHVSPNKFLGTKQFTISGSRTFHGTVPPSDRSDGSGWYYREHGEHSVTWKWEATFRLDKPKKPRRHGRRA
jgi:hypothetical protein